MEVSRVAVHFVKLYSPPFRIVVTLNPVIQRIFSEEGYEVKEPPKKIPPKCPKCGSLLRPDVVWFGEPLPKDVWTEAVMEAMKSDVLLVIGTSGLVAPASMIPTMAHQRGSSIVEINPEDTPISSMAEIKVRSPAGSFFKELIERLRI